MGTYLEKKQNNAPDYKCLHKNNRILTIQNFDKVQKQVKTFSTDTNTNNNGRKWINI